MTENYVIEMKGITKEFGTFKANDNINLQVKKGEIHALLGENGAGKSTLMNILSGILSPTSGSIHVKGKEVAITSPDKAAEYGIGMVHQHFMLVDKFTVTENIMLGKEEHTMGYIDNKSAEKRIQELLINMDSKLIQKLLFAMYQLVCSNGLKLLKHFIKDQIF